jgi:outer membrane protein TolC/anti-anti-sigma regulatory factor
MLRISIFNEPYSITVKAEGKIIQDWADELRKTWVAISGEAGNRKKIIDLFNVSFVDEMGRQLLMEMHAAGAKLLGSGPMISGLIEEIKQAGRPHRSGVARKVLLSILILLALVTVAHRAFAQQPAHDVLTLQQAIVTAKEHNRQIQIQRLEVVKAQDDVAIAKTKRLPSLSADLFGSGLLNPINFEFEQGVFGTFPGIGPIPATNTKITADRAFNLLAIGQVQQPVSQLYRINLGIQAREAGRKIAAAQASRTEQEVLHDVRRAYYAIVQTRSAREANQSLLLSLRELQRVLQDRLQQQMVLPADAMEAKAALARAEQDSLTYDNDLAAQKEQLNLLLGRDPAEGFEIEPVPAIEWQEEDLAQIQVRALAQRPELREYEQRIKAADYDRRIKKSERLPDVGGFMTYTSPFNVELVPKNIAAAGIQVTWEPFDWGRKSHELAQREKILQQTRLASQQQRDAVRIEVARAYRGLKQAKSLADVARLNTEATTERLRVVTNQFEQRAALAKDVLDAQDKLAAAQHKEQESLLAFWTAKADFAKAIGEDGHEN